MSASGVKGHDALALSAPSSPEAQPVTPTPARRSGKRADPRNSARFVARLAHLEREYDEKLRRGSGVPVGLFMAFKLLLFVISVAMPFVSGRYTVSDTQFRWRLDVDVWHVCGKRQTGFTSADDQQQPPAEAVAMLDGCRPIEDSVCANDAVVLVHLLRFFVIVDILVILYVLVFAALDATRALNYINVGCVQRLNRRKHLIITSACELFLSLCCAIGVIVMWSQLQCLGTGSTAAPALVIYCVCVLASFAVLAIAIYYRKAPDYATMFAEMSELNRRNEEKLRANAATGKRSHYGGTASPDIVPTSSSSGRPVRDLYADDELDRPRAPDRPTPTPTQSTAHGRAPAQGPSTRGVDGLAAARDDPHSSMSDSD